MLNGRKAYIAAQSHSDDFPGGSRAFWSGSEPEALRKDAGDDGNLRLEKTGTHGIPTDETRVSSLLRKAESIFEIAIAPAAEYDNAAVVVDRAGGIVVLNCAEWSLPGIVCEFGASEVYLVERKTGKVSVEAWSTDESWVVTSTRPADVS